MTEFRVISSETTTWPAPAKTTRWLNHAEAAAHLGVSENKLREMRAAWKDAHGGRRIEKRLGDRGVRFIPGELDELLEWWSAELDRRDDGEEPTRLEVAQ